MKKMTRFPQSVLLLMVFFLLAAGARKSILAEGEKEIQKTETEETEKQTAEAGGNHPQRSGITICILDSGCSDPEVLGWNYIDQNENLTDLSGHGTKICRLLQEQVPWVELIMLKCFEIEEVEEAQEGWIVQALQDATELYHADVISMSWATVTESEVVHEAVRKADQAGCILVASAGNLSLSTPLGSTVYPAAWEEVIGVGGVDLNEKEEPTASLWYLQSEAVYVCADGSYDGERGSSFAVPRAAGVIAEYLNQHPESDQEAVMEYLKETAVDIEAEGYDLVSGWGYIRTKKETS